MFWDYETITHIKYSRLQELIFSVDNDAGYLYSVEWVQLLDAPNLRILNLSNMEEGFYSLRAFRKTKFPELGFMDHSTTIHAFRDKKALE